MRSAIKGMSAPITSLAVLSFAANVLMLSGPLFMLQVYDRVLVSNSVPTLVTLTVIVAVLFAFYGVIDAVRSRLTARISNLIDERLRSRLFRTAVRLRLANAPDRVDPVRDGDTIRNFVASPGLVSFLDLPWVPIYVALIFLLHPGLGWLAVAGVVVITGLLVLNQFISTKLLLESTQFVGSRQNVLDDSRQNVESVLAMGMLQRMQGRWLAASDRMRALQDRSSDRSSGISSASKAVRFFLQSAVLALGAFLVIEHELSAGVMIAASVITSRALAPVEQVVGQWRGFTGARQAFGRIKKALALPDLRSRDTLMPLPVSSLSVGNLAAVPPGAQRVVLSGINFSLAAGECLGVVGPTGSGKTSLIRVLVGLWPAAQGDVRLDGSDIKHFDPSQLGDIVGYLPQRVELFEGTVAENISRFEDDPSSERLIEAARAADIHELIAQLPDGYDSQVGDQGLTLSAGQRQRIGLARAIYGWPFLVVLDEPSSNLDAEGDKGLSSAVEKARARGSIVVIVSHRPNSVQAATHLLVLNGGKQVGFGSPDELMTAGDSKRPPLVARS